MCVILVVYRKSCVCYFTTSNIPSLTPSLSTVAALSNDFTGEIILIDEVFTVRFVAAKLSPLKEYRAPIVHIMVMQPHARNLSLYGFPAI